MSGLKRPSPLPTRDASPELLAKITEKEPQVALIPEGDHVGAALKLHGYDDMYLYAARVLDPRVVEQLREVSGAAAAPVKGPSKAGGKAGAALSDWLA
jgi:two-component system, NtrC family, nitrogen regulation sensor histidine kinase NtrY